MFMISGMTGHVDDSARLAARVTGDSTTLPSSDSRNEKERNVSCYLQVWVATGKLLVEAMLSDILRCYQADVWISAQHQSLP